MSSSEPRGDRLTADDFIAYGSDSVDGLTESSSGGLAEPLSSSTSQNLKRGGRPRLQEQKTAGMPQWYIKKIQDRTASRKQMADLQALLQGPDSDWIRQFAELGGMTILAHRLYQLSRKSSPRQEDISVEYEVVRCITYILNHRSATRVALAQHPQDTVTRIVSALSIPHLPTRRLVLDILVFLVYWNGGSDYMMVITGLEALSEDNDAPGGCYAFWFSSLHSLLAGRGRMGTLVGASPDFRRSGATSEDTFAEYLLSNILLMNSIMAIIEDVDLRLHHRSLMESSGLHAILDLARTVNIPGIEKQLDLFQQTLDDDAQSLGETPEATCDLSNLDEVFSTLRTRVQDSKAQANLLSILQHFLLVRTDDPTFLHRFQLLDTVVTDLVMDQKLGGAEKRMGLSVERIVGQLQQVELAKDLETDLIKSRSTVLQLKAENEHLEERMSHTEALVGTLQTEIARLQAALATANAGAARSPKAFGSGFADAALKENVPPVPRHYSPIPRLTFRGFTTWFGSPQTEVTQENRISGVFDDADESIINKAS